MTRTTICLNESLFKQAKKIAKQEHSTLGETMSELLSLGIQSKAKRPKPKSRTLTLPAFSMGTPLIPFEDQEAIFSVLEKGKRKRLINRTYPRV